MQKKKIGRLKNNKYKIITSYHNNVTNLFSNNVLDNRLLYHIILFHGKFL